MLEFNELKIGNYVKCKVSNDAGFYKVLSLDGWMLQIMLDGVRRGEWYPSSKIKPIKLTPETLEKCGFKDEGISKDPILELGDLGIHLTLPDSNGSMYLTDYGEHLNIPTFKYVHQLQNLYFALTGKELEINL